MNTPTPETQLIIAAQMPLATQPAMSPQVPSVGAMLSAVIDKGVTAENVGALEKLVELYERMEQRNAEKQFAEAFVKLQGELPVIVAETVIANRGKYARFEDVMHQISPVLVRNGFTVSFSMDFRDGRILETCTLAHVGGHSRANSFAVRTGKADSDTQADCKAATTAKRNALLNCLNIVVRQDALQSEEEDASLEGAFISVAQVCFLRELVAQTKSDIVAFLAFAGAAKFEEIPTSRYDRLVAALRRKASAV
jgi:hypothetical protein